VNYCHPVCSRALILTRLAAPLRGHLLHCLNHDVGQPLAKHFAYLFLWTKALSVVAELLLDKKIDPSEGRFFLHGFKGLFQVVQELLCVLQGLIAVLSDKIHHVFTAFEFRQENS
jgi:hypothetical protein